MWPVYTGERKLCLFSFIIINHANINASNVRGETPLFLVRHFDHNRTMELFMEHEAENAGDEAILAAEFEGFKVQLIHE